MVSRGDICWVEEPNEKRRPALVLTREVAIPVMRHVIVAYLTTTIRGIPTEVLLDPGDGVPRECVISMDNLGTVNRSLLSEPITTLSGPRMYEVCRTLAIAIGCD